ncbi:MAG: fructose-bisphosphate aldolase class I [Planctomycetota bacterium]|nr:MAG: fructose-bisphosphate aldolase class I [Planctomycetota bacterium]
MNRNELRQNAAALVADGKGILAADESTGTCTKRFVAKGVESTPENRRNYRNVLFTTEGMEEFISGVILYDETIRQASDEGTPFPQLLAAKGVLPGIKVDTGAKDLALHPGEKVTEGLDGLRERCEEYYALGARFAKWRAVIAIGEGLPSTYCLEANAHALARYAAICQENGLVPIVEPEVLMDGDHDIARSYEVTARAQQTLFRALFDHGCFLEGLLLKPSMVISGKNCAQRAGVEEVARETVRCLRNNVPASVPGIVFLSGGQSPQEASAHLDAMNRLGPHPWKLSFSYGRALQEPALDAWSKGIDDPKQKELAQKAFYARAKLNGAAARGAYSAELEKELVGAS